MEDKFKSLSLFNFQALIPDDELWLRYHQTLNGVWGIGVANVVMTNIVKQPATTIGSVQAAIT